jgi:hypothetical protein
MKFYATMDLTSGYYQFPIDPASGWMTDCLHYIYGSLPMEPRAYGGEARRELFSAHMKPSHEARGVARASVELL